MEQEHGKNTTGIQFSMDEITNRLLEKSASASMRTKKAEAAIRLADHVRRFPSIDQVNKITSLAVGLEEIECG